MPRDYSRHKVGADRQVQNIDETVEDDLTVTDALDVNGILTFNDELIHGAQKSQTKTANYTLAEGDSGQMTKCATDGVVFTLPSTVVGMIFTVVNTGADGAVGISLDPAAVDKIMGAGFTSADNKDVTNTKATAKRGDMITVLGDGVNGWFVVEMRGTWAREA